MNPNNTLLEIVSGMGQPLYAARGLTQTLQPIDAARKLTRSVNGASMDLSYSQFRKYKSTITCNDVETPSIDNVWPGDEVVIRCACELSYLTSGGVPGRTVVPGSERTEGLFTFYRPQLTMVVGDFRFGFQEYEANYEWEVDLEEA